MKSLIRSESGKNLKHSKNEINSINGFFIKKTINPFYLSLSLVLYSALIVFGTLKVTETKTVQLENSKQYESIKNEIILEIQKSNNLNRTSRNSISIKNEMEILRSEIIEQVNKINLKYLDLVENKKKKYSKVISDLAERKPASITAKGKAIPYSQINENLLTFKFQKRIDRERERLKKYEQKVISTLDLSKDEDLEKMKLVQDETEFALYELKQRLYKRKADFRKNKYIVLNN